MRASARRRSRRSPRPRTCRSPTSSTWSRASSARGSSSRAAARTAATALRGSRPRSRWTRSCSRSRARSRRWSASPTLLRARSRARTTARRATPAPPSCSGCACRWASSRRSSAPRWPSSSSSRAAASTPRSIARPRASPRCRSSRPAPDRLQNPGRPMPLLEIRNLHVNAGDKHILKGVDLTIEEGQIHALMGPNGSGKSTLANVIMGHPNLEVTEGEIVFRGEDITEADVDERARAGLFMAFQYPVSVPGVTVTKYLRTVMNAHRESRGEDPVPLKEFRKTVEAAMELTEVPREFVSRYLNEGFSGGEKKRMEILQLALQKPRIAVLDETDSGLDIDALNVVAHGVNTLKGPDMGVLIITHYQRILHMVKPSHVHVLYQGRIVKEGGPELVSTLEEKGYGWIREEVE